MWSCIPSRMLRLGRLAYVDPGSLDRFEEGRQGERQAMLRQLDTEAPDRWLTVEDIMGLNRRPPDPNDNDLHTPRPGMIIVMDCPTTA